MDDFSRNKKFPGATELLKENTDIDDSLERDGQEERKSFEEALAKADAVLLEEGEVPPPRSPSDLSPKVDGSGSLRDVIDQVEKQLMSSFKDVDSQNNTRPEELEVLDIEAELGRPDPGVEGILGTSESVGHEPQEDAPSVIDASGDLEEDKSATGYQDYDMDEETAGGDFSSLIPLAPAEFENPQVAGWDASSPYNPDFEDYENPFRDTSFKSQGGFPRLDFPDSTRTGNSGEQGFEFELDELSNDNDVPTNPNLDRPGSGEMTRVLEAPTPTVAPIDYSEGLRFGDQVLNRGSLSNQPLWFLLISAMVDRSSGVLLLVQGGIERKLYLDQGDVVVATSTAREDRLVELLYREGRLSDDEYSQAVLTIGASGRKVGAILVERCLISSRELFPLVRHHYENIILDSFGWREGTWQLLEEDGFGGERILLEVSTATLVVEGIRSRAPWRDVDALIPLASMPMEIPSAICPIEEIGLLAEELAIYRACDGSTDVSQISRRFEFPIREVRGLLAGLVVLGALYLEPFEREIEGEVPGSYAHNGEDEFAEIQDRLGAERGFRVERLRLADKMAQVKEGTYFALLEVSPDASGHEIRKSYRNLKGQFAVERYGVPELQDLVDQVLVVRQIIDEAYEVLRNFTVREAYRQRLAEEL